MTPVFLVGLLVLVSIIVSITWIEPKMLGGPPVAGRADDAAPSSAVSHRALRPLDAGPGAAPGRQAKRAA